MKLFTSVLSLVTFLAVQELAYSSPSSSRNSNASVDKAPINQPGPSPKGPGHQGRQCCMHAPVVVGPATAESASSPSTINEKSGANNLPGHNSSEQSDSVDESATSTESDSPSGSSTSDESEASSESSISDETASNSESSDSIKSGPSNDSVSNK